MNNIENQLDHPDRQTRLEALSQLSARVKSGETPTPERGGDVNNHIHTIYSFSPYSPAKAVWKAYMAGLSSAGIMDHDSVGGAEEFIKAAAMIDLPVTVGFECRCDFSSTALVGKRINNPDQKSVGYVAVHGIPHNRIADADAFLRPLRQCRNARNRLMTESINRIFGACGIQIDFSRDVLPVSKHDEGGSVTERHLLFALSKALTAKFGRGAELVRLLSEQFGIEMAPKTLGVLNDPDNELYHYDLLGVLKSGFVRDFYIDATGGECPPIADLLAFSDSIGAISAYAYLGDVSDSVTGDKAPQKFEDDYIETLFAELGRLGFKAVTYMPSRNTRRQLERVMGLCRGHKFLQISGEDINSPRQRFICEAMRGDGFKHLAASTWALIAHERRAERDPAQGLFGAMSVASHPDLDERVEFFSQSLS